MDDPDRQRAREELYKRIWSAPTIQVAAEMGISDVALAKRCKGLNVPKPTPGHWAKVAAGQNPPKTILPSEISKTEPLNAPVPNRIPLPEDGEQLHPAAVELARVVRVGTPDSTGCVKIEEKTLPRATVSPVFIGRTAKAFHVILTALETRGIMYVPSRSKYESAYFRRENDVLLLRIEEETTPREPTAQEKRRSDWSWRQFAQPAGKLIFKATIQRYSSRNEQTWTESAKMPIEEVLSKLIQFIFRHYLDLQKQHAEEAERREREARAAAVRLEADCMEKHEEAIQHAEQARAEDLLKAGEWWRLFQNTTDFIKTCEERWRTAQSGELTRDQEIWILWAKATIKSLSPFETGYPDPAKDGVFDAAAIPVGGPYPAKRDFPDPPTMRKIPPPVIQHGGYSEFRREQPPYPYWLKFQRR